MENTEIKTRIELPKLEDFGITKKEIEYYRKWETIEDIIRSVFLAIIVLFVIIMIDSRIIHVNPFIRFLAFAVFVILFRLTIDAESNRFFYIQKNKTYQNSLQAANEKLKSSAKAFYNSYFDSWTEQIVDYCIENKYFTLFNFPSHLEYYSTEMKNIMSDVKPPIKFPKKEDYVSSLGEKGDINMFGCGYIFVICLVLIIATIVAKNNILIFYMIVGLTELIYLIFSLYKSYKNYHNFSNNFVTDTYFNIISDTYRSIFLLGANYINYTNDRLNYESDHKRNIDKLKIAIKQNKRYIEHKKLWEEQQEEKRKKVWEEQMKEVEKIVEESEREKQRRLSEKIAKQERIAIEKQRERQRKQAEKIAEQERIAVEKERETQRKQAEKIAEQKRIVVEKEREQQRKQAEKIAEQERIAVEKERERQRKQAEKIAKGQKNKEIEEIQHQETEEEKEQKRNQIEEQERNSLKEYQTRIIKGMNERQEKEQKEKHNQEEQRKKAQEAEKERQAKRQKEWEIILAEQEQQRKQLEDSTKVWQKEIYDETGTKNGEITIYQETNSEEEERKFTPKKPNYSEIDKKKIEIGLAGELYVIAFEKERLKAKRQPNLANDIEHVSQTQGDGKGYDILSFTEKGYKMYIEVKTTEKSINESVFFTQNEMDFMREHKSHYYLYRVYDFDKVTKTGQLYILKGYQQVADYFDFKPTQYKGKIKMEIP